MSKIVKTITAPALPIDAAIGEYPWCDLLSGFLCGCGYTHSAVTIIYQHLFRQHHQWTADLKYCTDTTDGGVFQIVEAAIEQMGLSEHGTSIRCSWLTKEGEAVFQAMTEYGFKCEII